MKKRDYGMLLKIYNDLYIWTHYYEYNNKDKTDLLLERIEYDLLFENCQPIETKLTEFMKIAQENIRLHGTIYNIQKNQLKEILQHILQILQKDKKMDDTIKKQLIQ